MIKGTKRRGLLFMLLIAALFAISTTAWAADTVDVRLCVSPGSLGITMPNANANHQVKFTIKSYDEAKSKEAGSPVYGEAIEPVVLDLADYSAADNVFNKTIKLQPNTYYYYEVESQRYFKGKPFGNPLPTGSGHFLVKEGAEQTVYFQGITYTVQAQDQICQKLLELYGTTDIKANADIYPTLRSDLNDRELQFKPVVNSNGKHIYKFFF